MSYSPTDGNDDQQRRGSQVDESNERSSLLQSSSKQQQQQNYYSSESNDNNITNEPISENDQKQEGWRLDATTKYFSLSMFLLVVILTVCFSIMAKRDADNNNNGPNSNNYIYDECKSFRVFTLWKTWSGVTNASSLQQQQQANNCMKNLGLVRGKPFPCTSSLECQLNIPSYCLYGDPKFLVCHPATKLCSVKTASLPVSLELPSAGVCPLFDNTTDRCGDLMGTASDSTSPSQAAIATRPVVCVTTSVCSDIPTSEIRCHQLYPNKTQ